MIYYNYNPYLLYLLKIPSYAIGGKPKIKILNKVIKTAKNSKAGEFVSKLLKTDHYYVQMLNDLASLYKKLSVNDFLDHADGWYNDVSTIKSRMYDLINHENPRILEIAREIYNQILVKEQMAEVISLYKKGRIAEGREKLDALTDIRNTAPGYLNDFENELSKAYTTTPSMNNIIADENAAKEEAARVETRKKNLEKKNYLNTLNSEFEEVFESGDPSVILKFRNKHSSNKLFKGSDADKLSSELIEAYHDDYYLDKIQNSNDINQLQEYLDIYPEGKYAKDISTKLGKLKEALKKDEEVNSKIADLLRLLESQNKLIEQSNKEHAEALNNLKKSGGLRGSIRRHPWRTAGIAAGITFGGGTIAGGLYLLGRGVITANQAGWELTTGKPDSTTVDTSQSNIEESTNNINTNDSTSVNQFSEARKNKANASQGQ